MGTPHTQPSFLVVIVLAMNKAAESKRHRTIGTILMSLAVVCILLSLDVMYYFPGRFVAVVFWIVVAIILGNYAFHHFEKYAKCKPDSPIRHQMELFSTSLKNQSDVSIFLELHYPIEQDSPYLLDRIRGHYQRTLNIALAQLDTLPENPYAYIDSVLSAETPGLCDELNLTSLVVKTIDVRTTPASAAGVRLRTTP